MLELSEDRSSIKMASDSGESEFSSSTMPKRRHFYTNAAPAKFEGTFFRYDFEDKVRFFISFILNSYIAQFEMSSSIGRLTMCVLYAI